MPSDLHHLLLGILEALCDEVERLLLRDGVLGHPRLLGLERKQLGFSCTQTSTLCYKLTYIKYICSVAWLGLTLNFQKDDIFRENLRQDYLEEVGYLPCRQEHTGYGAGRFSCFFIHYVVHLEPPNYQHLWRQYTTKILSHNDAPTILMLVYM